MKTKPTTNPLRIPNPLKRKNQQNKSENHLISCYGVIFLLKGFKCECRFFCGHIPVLAGSAFLCAVGGVLVWINGGSGCYLFAACRSSSQTLSLTAVFLMWLCVYALTGAVIGMIGLLLREVGLLPFALAATSYLLGILWYALFFCTRLSFFAAVLLIGAVALNIIIMLKYGRCSRLMDIILVLITAAEVFFIIWSF